jgi:hypothetical protein
MNELTDDNAPAKITAPASQDMARKFTFAGIELMPYSRRRRATFYRVRSEAMSGLEWAVLHLYICTQSPAQCDAAVDDKIQAFRSAALDWGDKINASDAEFVKTSQAIEKNVADADSVEPDISGGSAGNA